MGGRASRGVRRKGFASLALAAALALAATAATGSTAANRASAKRQPGIYQLGSTGDLSANLASIGTALRTGYQTYISWQDKRGGINGHQIKLTALDDASDPTRGVANIKQLTDSDVSGVFVFLSNVIVASAPILNAKKTPAIVQAAIPTLLNPVQPYIFSGSDIIGDQPGPMTRFALAKLRGVAKPRIGIIAGISAALSTFVAGAKAQVDAQKDSGWELASTQSVALTSTTAAPQAESLAASKPDFVFMALVDPLAISAVQALRNAGYKGPIVNYDGGSAFSTLQRLNDPNFYVVRAFNYVGGGGITGPELKRFEKAAKAFGVDPNQAFVVNGYVHAYVMGQALKKCGYPCPGEKLQTALESLRSVPTEGLTFGPFSYSANAHQGVTKVQIFTWGRKLKKPVPASKALPIDFK